MMLEYIIKNNQTLRVLMILGISLVVTLVLVQRFVPFSLVHARAAPAADTCAATAGKDQALCLRQDPIMQGCAKDAHSLAVQYVYTTQNTLIGEVDLRHSNTCKTYWVRTIGYANAVHLLSALHASISFPDGTTEDIPAASTFLATPAPIVVFTDMTTSINPQNVGKGTFELLGQSQPLLIPLPVFLDN